MAEHDRPRAGIVANEQIGVAHAGRDDADQRLVGSRRAQAQCLDPERAAAPADDSGSDLSRSGQERLLFGPITLCRMGTLRGLIGENRVKAHIVGAAPSGVAPYPPARRSP
jgi:hypothetical protein